MLMTDLFRILITKGKEARACSSCDEVEYREVAALGHDYSDFTIKEATCEENGSMTRTCKRCEKIDTRVLKATGHKAIILPTNEQLYANSIANLKGYFKEYRNNKMLS